MSSHGLRWLTGVALAAATIGCQHDVTTLFPPGLEPLPDDAMAGAIDAPIAEALVMTNTTVDGEVRVYGRGYVFEPVFSVWGAAQTPQALIAMCSTNAQVVTENDETGYELDFLVAYTVNNILTVQWDDQFRGDVISVGLGSDQMNGSGEPGDTISRTIIHHQKTMGSSFITTSEGTTQMFANATDSMTELQFVEHLNAAEEPVDQVETGMQHEFDSLVSIAHGGAVTACPQ